MRVLSSGDRSVLGSYLKLTRTFFGVDSPPHLFIKEKIKASPKGDQEEVIASEEQMIFLFGQMMQSNKDDV